MDSIGKLTSNPIIESSDEAVQRLAAQVDAVAGGEQVAKKLENGSQCHGFAALGMCGPFAYIPPHDVEVQPGDLVDKVF